MSEKDQKLLIYFGLFLAGVVICYWILPSLISQVQLKREEIGELEKQLEETKNITLFEEITRTYKQNREPFGQLDFLVFKRPEVLQYATLLETAASQSGVKVQSFSFGRHEKSEIGEYGQILLTLNVNGAYFELKEFLRRLERTLPLMSVQRLTFSAPSGGELYSFTLWILTYTEELGQEKSQEEKPSKEKVES